MTTHHEQWKPVPLRGFGEHYGVSSYGRVRRLTSGPHTRAGRVLCPSATREGLAVRLTRMIRLRDGTSVQVSKGVLVHRLVWAAFVEALDSNTYVVPRNGDKGDARLVNLTTRRRPGYDEGMPE